MSSELKLKYLNTFIDVEEPLEALEGSKSLEQDQHYVRDLSLKLQTLTVRTLKAAVPRQTTQRETAIAAVKNLSGGVSKFSSVGTIGHPELCCRPCLHFVQGYCSDGTNCGFCHEAHSTKEAKLDKMQREIMQSLTIQQSAALILAFVRSRLLQMDVSEKHALLDCLEHEASTHQVLPRSISSLELRRLRKTLSRMNVYSLLAVFTSRDSQYSEEDRVRAEVVFSFVQSIRNQLVLQKETSDSFEVSNNPSL
eukprot:Skav200254  [mRNA]  locus=scaffold128:113271:119637:+ [translate_table: standard]